MHPPFDAWQFHEIAAELAARLDERRTTAEPAAARLLTERVSDHICHVSIYGDSNGYPTQQKAFGEVFPSWEGFIAALREESPGAIEVAIDLLSRVDPMASMPIALVMFERKPWKMLWGAAARALARCADERAFRALLADAEQPGVGTRIAVSEYRGGLGTALALLEENPTFWPSLLAYLGKLRADEAWPVLADHWRARGDHHSGHPLLRWGDERSLDLLEAGVRGDTRWRRFFGVAAYLARDPARAIERLGGHDALLGPESAPVAGELLEQIGRRLDSRRLEDAPLDKHPSYLDLALARVKDKPTKDVAQWVINAYSPDEIADAKQRARARVRVAGKTEEPKKPLVDETAAFDEAMAKARENLERITKRLKERGYRFVRPRSVLAKPSAASKRALAHLEKAVGPLPPAFRAALAIIVACDLRGSHPEWPRSASLDLEGAREPIWHTDPFVLVPAVSLIEEAEDHEGDEAAYTLAFAPDDVGKAGYSGGRHTIDVPGEDADPPIEGAHFEGTFVGYLREVFRWGGFPGFARIEDRPQELLDELAALCTPI